MNRKISSFQHLELLAKQIVESFISGMHKSPFHGLSAEFAEHKIYNVGESTKHIDWKLFAKTDRLYTKKYEEETNLRCHLIIDNSSSMHYPKLNENQFFYEIPYHKKGTTVEYFISAESKSGRKETQPRSAPLGTYQFRIE